MGGVIFEWMEITAASLILWTLDGVLVSTTFMDNKNDRISVTLNHSFSDIKKSRDPDTLERMCKWNPFFV